MLGRKTGGRQKGTLNKKTILRQKQAEAAATGVMPCDVMLDNMRFAYNRAVEMLAKIVEGGPEAAGNIELLVELIRLRQIAQKCAKDAAPYYHAKLAAITHKGDPDNPLLGPVTDVDRINAIVAFFKANPDVLKLVMAELMALAPIDTKKSAKTSPEPHLDALSRDA
jgi:hypothetical protein